MRSEAINLKQDLIIDWVKPGSSVLELGCGDGDLLIRLIKERRVRAQGIEVDNEFIHRCVQRGLNVLHEQIDEALFDYKEQSFDYAVFAQSLQRVVKQPDIVLREALRVSKKVIVGFPNFAHYQARWQIIFKGRTPVTPSLPYQWYDTPNLHFLSIADFVEYCRTRNIGIERTAFTGKRRLVRVCPNLRALTGWFLISRLNE